MGGPACHSKPGQKFLTVHTLTAIVLTAHALLAWLQQITKRKVDYMLWKSNPAHCLLAVKWRGEWRCRFPDVSRRVDLEGAKRPDHYFSIQLPDRGSIRPSLPTY